MQYYVQDGKQHYEKKAAADYYDPVKVKMHKMREIPVSFFSSPLLSYYTVPIRNIWIVYVCACVFIFACNDAFFWCVLKVANRVRTKFPMRDYSAGASMQMR